MHQGAGPLELTAEAMFVALRRLREVHPDMTVLQAMAFLQVAAKPGVSQKAIGTMLEAGADSTASRILGLLADVGFRGTKGLNLVEFRNNPMDRRERLMFLSPKGKRLMVTLATDVQVARELSRGSLAA